MTPFVWWPHLLVRRRLVSVVPLDSCGAPIERLRRTFPAHLCR